MQKNQLKIPGTNYSSKSPSFTDLKDNSIVHEALKVWNVWCRQAGGGGDGGKRRRTAWGGRDFVVTIVFAARVSMKPLAALLELKPGPQAQKAEAALRVLDVVLREVASSRYDDCILFLN